MCGLSDFNPFNIRHGTLHAIATNPVLSKIIPIVATAVGGPLAGAAASGLEGYAGGEKPIDALKTAGLSFAGNEIGSSIGGSILPGTVGNAIGSTASNAVGAADAGISGALGQGFSQTASNAILNTGVGSTLGGLAGSNIAQGLMPQKTQGGSVDNNSLLPAAYKPQNIPQLQLPGSLSGLAGLSSDQQTSNLATQGVYGGGLGPQEQQYFTGLVNNQLVDPSGKTSSTSSLSPIENSYLSQLGFNGYSNSNDLLGAISQWQKQQQGTSATT